MPIVNKENTNEMQRYEEFVSSYNGSSLMQSIYWSKAKFEWIPEYVYVEEDGKIVAAMSVLLQKVPHIKSYMAYAARGPVCDIKNIELVGKLVEEVEKLREKYNIFMFKFDPNIKYDENIEIGLKAAAEKTTVKQLAEKCKAVFGTAACTLPEKQVEKVFICAGSGSGMTEEILDSGAECFITGECKYHDMLDLDHLDIAVITTAHDASEKISLEKLALILENENIKTEIYTADNLQTVI